jgi:type IV secretory pathway VirB2 component (pilin)
MESTPSPRALRGMVAELIVVGGLSSLALFWIIPSQTTIDPSASLQPGLLPTVCVVAILFLSLMNALGVLWRRAAKRPEALTPAWRAAGGTILITLLGIVAYQVAGMAATAIVIVPGLMLWLGERRWKRIGIVSFCAVLPFTPLFS